MMFPQLAQFTDVALLLLRVMVGLVFITSGWKHLKDPEARSKDIGMSKGFTIFLGAAEVAGSLGVIFGVLTQLAAAGLILIMLGAIQKKNFVWRTGFWGDSGTNGWSYDTMLVVMNLVIVATGGGNLSLMKWVSPLQLSKKVAGSMTTAGTLAQSAFYARMGIRIRDAACAVQGMDRRRVPPTSPGQNSEEQRLKVGLDTEWK